MKRWSAFAAEKPEMAEAGHALLYQFRVGLGYLANYTLPGRPGELVRAGLARGLGGVPLVLALSSLFLEKILDGITILLSAVAVGTTAVRRFLRPVTYQNWPDSMLPAALQTSNPLNISRVVNGHRTHDAV